ncbi:hypothetical protein GCM10009129_19760 [Psychrobacter aestuarii]|uniref:4'-phosphopantetheinyl transferase domain-containing protein n=1 Tax=Psychrobacter aestuarii TaxID=556327 RepID=A0ABP3FQA0_9GAMM
MLHHLLGTLGIVDALDEQRFPYRLVKTGKYVCFSHSQTCVAVALSDMHPIGIDVETQAIDWRVAKRFYHADDVRQLQRLPIDKRAMVSLWLWQIKESFIKIHQYTLAQGLGVHYANLVAALIAISDEPTTPVSITLDSHTVHLAHTPSITVVYKIAH